MEDKLVKSVLTDKKIESIIAKALKDNPHWEVDAWGLFSVVAKEQDIETRRSIEEERLNRPEMRREIIDILFNLEHTNMPPQWTNATLQLLALLPTEEEVRKAVERETDIKEVR